MQNYKIIMVIKENENDSGLVKAMSKASSKILKKGVESGRGS